MPDTAVAQTMGEVRDRLTVLETKISGAEKSLDRITTILEQMAKVEEAQAQHRDTLSRLWNEVTAIKQDCVDLRSRTERCASTVTWLSRLLWGLSGVLASGFGTGLLWFLGGAGHG